jgi:ABC-type multidrug transport system ATPase subunit
MAAWQVLAYFLASSRMPWSLKPRLVLGVLVAAGPLGYLFAAKLDFAFVVLAGTLTAGVFGGLGLWAHLVAEQRRLSKWRYRFRWVTRPDTPSVPLGTMVSVQHLSYGVLRNASFEVGFGEVLAVIGPNGSGKTTLLRLLAGVALPERGEINVGGIDLVSALRTEKPLPPGFRIVFLEERIRGDEREDVLSYLVTMAQRSRVVPSDEWIQQVASAMAIGPLLPEPLRQLAPAQLELVRLAGGLVAAPTLLLVDEVGALVDAEAKRDILVTWREAVRAIGATVVATSIDIRLAVAAERAFFLVDGEVIDFPEALRADLGGGSERSQV